MSKSATVFVSVNSMSDDDDPLDDELELLERDPVQGASVAGELVVHGVVGLDGAGAEVGFGADVVGFGVFVGL